MMEVDVTNTTIGCGVYGFSYDQDTFVGLGARLQEWAGSTLGYTPKIRLVGDRVSIVFQNETDALLFRIQFAYAWSHDE